jgi:hypothetical protein
VRVFLIYGFEFGCLRAEIAYYAKGNYLINYFEEIKTKQVRASEIRCYYYLLGNGLSENQIESTLRKIHSISIPVNGEGMRRPLRYIINNWDQFFNGIAPTIVQKPDGL